MTDTNRVIVIETELTCSFDVDETLLMLKRGTNCPIEKKVVLDYYGEKRIRYPHIRHCALVRSHKKRGFFVTVHSANGYKWAKEAVEKLGLSEYVDLIKTKDQVTFDDKEDCGIPRVYVPDVGR